MQLKCQNRSAVNGIKNLHWRLFNQYPFTTKTALSNSLLYVQIRNCIAFRMYTVHVHCTLVVLLQYKLLGRKCIPAMWVALKHNTNARLVKTEDSTFQINKLHSKCNEL